MTKVEAMRSIKKAFKSLNSIESIEDLKKAKLSLSDYHAAMDIFNELSKPGSSAKTFISNVAAFYKKCGFNVVLRNINYVISTEA